MPADEKMDTNDENDGDANADSDIEMKSSTPNNGDGGKPVVILDWPEATAPQFHTLAYSTRS